MELRNFHLMGKLKLLRGTRQDRVVMLSHHETACVFILFRGAAHFDHNSLCVFRDESVPPPRVRVWSSFCRRRTCFYGFIVRCSLSPLCRSNSGSSVMGNGINSFDLRENIDVLSGVRLVMFHSN